MGFMNFFSPCRTHPCSPEHAALVLAFREAAQLWEETAEQATGGYVADMVHYVQSSPRPRFMDFLISYHRERRADAHQEGRPQEQADAPTEG